MDSKTNVVEFSCDLCGNYFHELQGGKCIECNKLLCPKCQDKFDGDIICVNCKNLKWHKEKKHEEDNIINSSADKTQLDYDEMSHNDKLKYDADYLQETKYRKIFENIDTIKLCLKIIFALSILGSAVCLVLYFRYGFDLGIFPYIFGYSVFFSMILLNVIHNKMEKYSFENKSEEKSVDEILRDIREQNE